MRETQDMVWFGSVHLAEFVKNILGTAVSLLSMYTLSPKCDASISFGVDDLCNDGKPNGHELNEEDIFPCLGFAWAKE